MTLAEKGAVTAAMGILPLVVALSKWNDVGFYGPNFLWNHSGITGLGSTIVLTGMIVIAFGFLVAIIGGERYRRS